MYKDEAEAEVVKFKELYGEDAMKTTRKKKAKKEEKEVSNDIESTPVAVVVATGKKEESGEEESKGDDAAKKSHKKKKKKEKKKDKTGDQKVAEKKEKEDLPSGWRVESKPRQKGNHVDKYFYSPVKAYKFPSEAQVRIFLSVLEQEGGDEVRAHQVYTENRKKKKKKKSSATDSNKKKSKKAKISDEEGEDAVADRDKSKVIMGLREKSGSDGDDDAMHKAAWGA